MKNSHQTSEKDRLYDAIIVLGSHQPTALYRRIRKGIALYQDNQSSRLLLCGGPKSNSLTEAEQMANTALNQGVPASAIILENQSTNTLKNAKHAAELCHKYNLQRLCLISDWEHLPRARLAFAAFGITPTHCEPATPFLLRGIIPALPSILYEALAYPYYWLKLKTTSTSPA